MSRQERQLWGLGGWGLIKIEGASWHTDPSHFSGPRAILNWDSREELKKNQPIRIVLSVDVVLATNQSKAYRFSGRTGMTIFRAKIGRQWILDFNSSLGELLGQQTFISSSIFKCLKFKKTVF